jgi:hypothetical protein
MRNRSRALGQVATAVAGLALVAGCSSDKDDAAAPSSTEPAVTSVPAGPAGSAGTPAAGGDWAPACELLTDAEVSGLAGGSVTASPEVAPGDLDGCVWTGADFADGSDFRVTRVQVGIAAESPEAQLATLESDEQPELVSGVGDGGVVWSDIFGTARAAIWDGDTVVFLFMDRGTASEITRDEVLPLVQAAGGRL